MTDDAKPRPLAVGDRVKDNDPRCAHRALYKVLYLNPADDRIGYARATLGTNNLTTIVALTRIHLDDKPRRGGWSRVP